MEIVGSVAPDEVPERRTFGRPGKWSAIGERAIADAKQGRVLVVRTKDLKEVKSMTNSLQPWLRKQGYKLRPAQLESGGEYRIFLELALREPAAEPSVNGTASG